MADPYSEFGPPLPTGKKGAADPYAEFGAPLPTTPIHAASSGAGGSWPPQEPGLLDTANQMYASDPNAPMSTRIAQSFGRTAMMVPNLISAATSGPTDQEKAEGYAPGFGSISDAAKTPYDRAVSLPVKHTFVDPSAAAYENVDQIAR